MTESLFDTKFTSEPTTASTTVPTNNEVNNLAKSTKDSNNNNNTNTKTNTNTNNNNDQSNSSQSNESNENDQVLSSTQLPSLEDESNSSALINYRVLVSAKEAGCLIGQNGQVINSIREETNTKAGISKLQPGSHERILTVSGNLDDSSKALSYFAQALVNSNNETLSSYSYFPLKQLSSLANIEGETTILRLLIPNSQMGTLIGSKGIRIQQIQSTFNISMIASKSFLPGSNERLVELQGTVDNLYDSLRIISRCLIEDFSSIVGTNYYVPRGYNYSNNNNNSNNSRGNYSNNSNGSTRKSSNFNNHSSSSSNSNNSSSIVSASVSFANDIVGALIGKNGSRIQGVRKVSGATIGISDETEGKGERIFTITGTSHAVDKAKELLYHNLEREEQRRAEIEESTE